MFPSRHLTFEMKKVEQLRIELCHWILEAHRNTYILNHTAGHLFISIEIALIDYLRPMKTIQPIPSVHPQSLLNNLLKRPWIDLSRPLMNSNQWPPTTSNDLQWPLPHSGSKKSTDLTKMIVWSWAIIHPYIIFFLHAKWYITVNSGALLRYCKYIEKSNNSWWMHMGPKRDTWNV